MSKNLSKLAERAEHALEMLESCEGTSHITEPLNELFDELETEINNKDDEITSLTGQVEDLLEERDSLKEKLDQISSLIR